MCVIAFIACDIWLALNVPKQAKALLNDTLSGAIVVFYGVGLYALLKFISTSTKYINDLIFFPIINDCIRTFKFAVCKHIARLPLLKVETISPAVVVSRFWRMSTSLYRVFKTLLVQVIPTIVKCVMICAALYKLQMLNDAAIWLSMGSILFIIGALFYYARLKKQCWTVTDTANAIAQDYLTNTYWHKYYYQALTGFLDQYFRKEAAIWQVQNMWLNLVFLSFEFTFFLFSCGVLYVTFTKIQNGILSGGDFLMVEGYLVALLIPLRELFTEIRAIIDTRIDLEPIQVLFKNKIETRHSTPNLAVSDSLEIKNISFGYPNITKCVTPDRIYMVRDLSLTLKKTDRLLITGVNGSGKTTLCYLILGLLSPSQGQILWHGAPVHTTPFDMLAQDIMYVSGQHPFLDQTVEMHMTFGQDIEQTILQDILQQVGLFVSMDTKVKELSLGERQRILLARALLLKPKILILDEALFMIDAKSQTTILKQFDACIDILIIVSHQQQNTLSFTHTVSLDTRMTSLK